MKICLDPGHGHNKGFATGARSKGIIEDDWALNFVNRLAHYIRAAGHQVITTRPTDAFVTLKGRAKIAKQNKANLFLSIHLNSSTNATAHGVEAYIVPNDARSKKVALNLVDAVVDAGIMSRGVKPDNASQHSSLYVLRNTYNSMPAVLLEVGFLSNEVDRKKLLDKMWVEALACELAKRIVD